MRLDKKGSVQDITINFQQKQKILLPQLITRPIRYGVGEACHLIRDEEEVEICSDSTIQISPRIHEKILELSNHEKIIFTQRKKLDLPEGADGAIKVLKDGSFKWIAHKKLIRIEAEINQNGLKKIAEKSIDSWKGAFNFKLKQPEESSEILPENEGLRPPQLGGLHSIGSHWSLKHRPATIIMPTGVGKTEIILSVLCAYRCSPLLVVVPSKALRDQTTKKFINFGLLKKLSLLQKDALYPVVGMIKKKPKTIDDLKIFEDCNVLISTISSLSVGTEELSIGIKNKCETLILDEAHHVAADTWKKLRESFKEKKTLQFTATPFRKDGKLVDGDIIYSYPLKSAQEDGYFKKINFIPINEFDKTKADMETARQAVQILKGDIENNLNHMLMARCSSISRAKTVLDIYKYIAPELNPTLIHSKLQGNTKRLEEIKSGSKKIIVCVNMLGEGFNLPELKVCALHDSYKSLAVVLQFTGRFTRSSGINLGEASVIANIADAKFYGELERLYSEDADWNFLLNEMSSQATQKHAKLIEFLNNSETINHDDYIEENQINVSNSLLKPALSTLIYKAEQFHPKLFFQGLPSGYKVVKMWLNKNNNTFYFITTGRENVKWTKSKEILETFWDLFVLHFDSEQKLLFLNSSNTSSAFEKIAYSVGANEQITGEIIFKCLGKIGRLTFQNLGVSKHGVRNLSYAMYTGQDVQDALSLTESSSSVKSNLSGKGWEQGEQITICCSRKGRVWSKKSGTIPEFIDWAKNAGRKLKDETIDTAKIIKNVLIPEEIDELPNLEILGIEWPYKILKYFEDKVSIKKDENENEILLFELGDVEQNISDKQIHFSLIHYDESVWGKYYIELGVTEKFKVFGLNEESQKISIVFGSNERPICEFFNDYPPLIRYVNLNELEGNRLIKPPSPLDLAIPDEHFEVWDWSGVDITKESIWRNKEKRENSIQWHVAQEYIKKNYQIVFDDDSPGEAADLVCINECDNHIELVLIHCKYSGGTKAGKRVKDVEEAVSQAIRSTKWPGKFEQLCNHLQYREHKRQKAIGQDFLLNGNISDIRKMGIIYRSKEVKTKIFIAQPGISKSAITEHQRVILAAGFVFLKETLGIDLKIICNE